MHLCPLLSPLCYFDLLCLSVPALPRISTDDRVGSQRTLLTQMFCIKDLRFVCNSLLYCVLATSTLTPRQTQTQIAKRNPTLVIILTITWKFNHHATTHPFPERLSASSDLRDPCDDLICPKQLNVLTGLVFEEGGELSQELPFCLSK